MISPTELTLVSDRGGSALAKTTRDLVKQLNGLGVAAELVGTDDDGLIGAKGDAISLGQLAIDLVTSGAVTALLECVKALFERDGNLRVKIGSLGLEITSHNVDDALTKAKLEDARPKHR